MMNKRLTFILLYMVNVTLANDDSVGSFEYTYSLQRQALQNEEHTLAGYRQVYDEVGSISHKTYKLKER